MKRIESVSKNGRGTPTANLRTGTHCPCTGYWRNDLDMGRYLMEGTLFPSSEKGPCSWSLVLDRPLPNSQ
ncbi:hypothetical protein QF036_002207 [Arthrobacter globiformis]|nr:hypothetical protein [Arthrobacter globiformis]